MSRFLPLVYQYLQRVFTSSRRRGSVFMAKRLVVAVLLVFFAWASPGRACTSPTGCTDWQLRFRQQGEVLLRFC